MIVKMIIYIALNVVVVVGASSNANADTRFFKVATIESAKLFPSIIEVVKEAYRQLNINIDITMMPAERAFLELESGGFYDAELGRVKAASERLTDFIRIPVLLVKLELSTVGSADLKGISGKDGIANFKKYRVASLRGILSSDKLLKGIDNYLIDTPKQGLEMLKYGRIDIFVVPNYLTSAISEYTSKHNIIIHTPPLLSANIYHYLHKKHANLAAMLTIALSAVTGNPIEILE